MQWNEDSNKLLVVRNDGVDDGGDTLANEARYWFNLYISKTFSDRDIDPGSVLNLLQIEDCVFIRNPIKYNDPNDVSRDQMTPLIALLGLMGFKDMLKTILKKQLSRWGLFPNKDIDGPVDFGNYIRAFKAWYLYPFLWLTDLGLVVESIIRNFSKVTDSSDDLDHTVLLIQAQHVLPTLISFIARKIYTHGRAQSSGGVQEAWDDYYMHGGNNPLNVLYEDLIRKM